MLAHPNRIVRGDDYRRVVRRGRRVTTPSTVVYRIGTDDFPPRFGFIVAKSVGNAVIRNRVRRRLKAICAEWLPSAPTGAAIVIRALPGSASATWVTLRSEVTEALDRGISA